jgi:hypothetical protein
MERNMVKFDTSSDALGDFAPFSKPDEFFSWVSTNHGSDVTAACKDRLQELANTGTHANALAVLRELVRSTRDVDVSRTGIRARFVY